MVLCVQGLAVTEGQEYREQDGTLNKSLTLTLPSVQRRHSGRFTCTAINQAGIATATVNLTVVGEIIITLYKLMYMIFYVSPLIYM